MLSQKTVRKVANSVDPDGTQLSVVSHLGLHSLLRPVHPNTYSKYSTMAK